MRTQLLAGWCTLMLLAVFGAFAWSGLWSLVALLFIVFCIGWIDVSQTKHSLRRNLAVG